MLLKIAEQSWCVHSPWEFVPSIWAHKHWPLFHFLGPDDATPGCKVGADGCHIFVAWSASWGMMVLYVIQTVFLHIDDHIYLFFLSFRIVAAIWWTPLSISGMAWSIMCSPRPRSMHRKMTLSWFWGHLFVWHQHVTWWRWVINRSSSSSVTGKSKTDDNKHLRVKWSHLKGKYSKVHSWHNAQILHTTYT